MRIGSDAQKRRRLSILVLGNLALGLVLGLPTRALGPVEAAGQSRNPYDKYRRASYSNEGLYSEQEEIRLGEELHKQLQKEQRLVRDPELVGYVQRLGERLARVSKRPDLDYHFFIIEDPTVNAFALPGGYVYVHTGLLATVESESELASVLGHEIGHVVARHGLKNFKRAQQYQFIVGLINLSIGAIGGESTAARLGQTASQLLAAGIFTKHSRDAEREADFLGLHAMYAAGYDPRGMISMFEKLERLSRQNPDLLGFVFRTHPPASERIRNTQAEITDHLALDPRLVRDTPAFSLMKHRLRELGFARNAEPPARRRRRLR
ncbi:Beta-barrel assembly-enhancing protease [bacterium HR10]|uniref:Peptidase M48, Ste24p n=1 Tax=uncultured Acidobacteriota bacterium TaxID=171953 RepID=H5SDD6_9BACT|nr:peptidase M48, Ste24p [uncultured Acidobacteriota bacterium]GBC83383.1 Beta-barrel assembly-enhancing protease [bacterium HR10]